MFSFKVSQTYFGALVCAALLISTLLSVMPRENSPPSCSTFGTPLWTTVLTRNLHHCTSTTLFLLRCHLQLQGPTPPLPEHFWQRIEQKSGSHEALNLKRSSLSGFPYIYVLLVSRFLARWSTTLSLDEEGPGACGPSSTAGRVRRKLFEGNPLPAKGGGTGERKHLASNIMQLDGGGAR